MSIRYLIVLEKQLEKMGRKIKTFDQIVDDAFKLVFAEKERRIVYTTGVGGLEAHVESFLKEGMSVQDALSFVDIGDYEGSPIFMMMNKPKQMNNKALFIDLDGTIIKTKSGETFPKNIDDWEFIDGVLSRIRLYRDNGYHICIVTNQAGIELGYITKEQFETKIDSICKEIEQYIGHSVNYSYCGYGTSYYRKPNPGFAYQFALELELDLRKSVMVGDMESDAKFAKNAMIGTYMDIKDFLEYKTIV